MCGIAGVSRITDITRRMIPELLYDMESRGRDSWGATDGSHDIRALGPITKSWFSPGLGYDSIQTWTRGIFHTRAASIGAVTIENCHPFTSVLVRDGGTPVLDTDLDRVVVGIHNGCISNHHELNTTYPDRNFEVDSMHIFEHIAKGIPVREIHGWGAIAWYEYTPTNTDGTLHLCRFNADNLHVVILTSGELVFCSTLEPIVRAAWIAGTSIKTTYKIDGDLQYNVEIGTGPDGSDQLRTGPTMVFGVRSAPVVALGNGQGTWDGREWVSGRDYRHGGSGGGGGGYTSTIKANIHTVGSEGRTKNQCLISGCTHLVYLDRSASLVCDFHFQRAITQVRGKVRRVLDENCGADLGDLVGTPQ